ncbi:MAG: phosphoenolpyruvate carboxykinase (ATP) [Chloroflexi bacterium]|nr:phosphoenolpyruvate carboxykinase (ATP) [Chloroflexota bacterium]
MNVIIRGIKSRPGGNLKGLEQYNLFDLKAIHWNLSTEALYQAAVERGEGVVAKNGPLVVNTAPYTGRSPNDKFIVREVSSADKIWWGKVNQPIEPDQFVKLHNRFADYARGKELFAQDLFVCADPAQRVPIRVVSELAWHSLFARYMFIRPTPAELLAHEPQFTVITFPGFKADPKLDGTRSEVVIAVNLAARLILIGGSSYAGETKKSIFSILNYLLPVQNVLSMHCSANFGPNGDSALFYGLSGTGKTTLSADPERTLIGDDEHGWNENGVFNFEGGCYAKVIKLRRDKEPEIFATTERFGTLLENVLIDPDSRALDLDSDEITENTRASYPIDFIPNATLEGRGGHPKNIFFLAADASGVLPPISKLNADQAMYHFLSGYTIEKYKANVWLVNTGWSGGAYGVGKRMDIAHTRALLRAALSGKLENAPMTTDPVFGFQVPTQCPDVPSEVLIPRNTWADKSAYDEKAKILAREFIKNFSTEGFDKDVPASVVRAGPKAE